MPRSSRHKSSKHSSRDIKEYSDSEKDTSLRDRKGKEESGSRVSKDSSLSEKRKSDSKDAKDLHSSGNGKHSEEHGSSKRRKERVEDGTTDRWNGGGQDDRGQDDRGQDDRGQGSKKSKAFGDLKSKKRDESVERHDDGEGLKRSSGKGEGRHRESSRKERDWEMERERRGREGRSERVADHEEHRSAKQVVENTDSPAEDVLRCHAPGNQLEMLARKKTDGFSDGNRHLDNVGDIRMYSKDDNGKDGRYKDEKQKDEKYKKKYLEDADRDSKHRDGKQRDERSTKDQISKSDDRYSRDEKDTPVVQQKRSKSQGKDRDRDSEAVHERERDSNRERDQDRRHGRDHRDRDHDHDRDWDWERDRDTDRYHERDYDHDGSHRDEQGTKHKDSRGRKRSPNDNDDCFDTKFTGSKSHHIDGEKKSLSGDRIESDAERGRSQPRPSHIDTFISSKKRRTSPGSISNTGADEYRYSDLKDLKYRNSVQEQRSKSRELTGLSGGQERGSKYRSGEKSNKADDGNMVDLLSERSSSSKPSPLGLLESSPSSTSIDRRYTNRTGVRRSLDVEETGRRTSASIDNREFSSAENRPSRDLPSEKPLVGESSQVDSTFYNRSSQGNSSSLISPPPSFRAGVDGPSFVGSLEDDNRLNSNGRYRRNNDSNVGRIHGNSWRGVPNWNSPLPNGFIPFQHGPPHGGFQAMLPQFPTPPLFGVRPPLDISHSGIPYHLSDAERFSSHMRPLGWQNMMDGSGPTHLHGWDGSNGMFRDEPHLYGGSEWDQNRHMMNGRGWDSSTDIWKGQNGDFKKESPFPSHKDDRAMQPTVDDVSYEEAGDMSHHEDSPHAVLAKTTETRSNGTSPAKDSSSSLTVPMLEETPDPHKVSENDASYFSRYYLSMLDISTDLASPELYDQCKNFLDTNHSATADEDNTTDIILEGGTRGMRSYNIVMHRPLFHPTKETYQRAIDLYKKQIMETRDMVLVSERRLDIILASNEGVVSGGTLDIVSLPCEKEADEQEPNCEVEYAKDPAPTPETENPGTPTSVIDEKAKVVHPDANEILEVLVATTGEEMQGHETSEGLQLNVNCKEIDGIAAEMQENTEGRGNAVSSPEKVLVMPASLSTDADLNEISETDGDVSADVAKEKLSLGDSMSGSLFFAEGPPKACEGLMPGSNESESVILTRIHHSPESTH